MSTSDKVAFTSLFISITALIFAIYGVWRANVTSAVATFISLNEAIRGTYSKLICSEEKDAKYQLAEFMNLLEIGAAAVLDGSFWGRPKRLAISQYRSFLKLLSEPVVSTVLEDLIEDKNTFENIRLFAKKHKAVLPICLRK